MTTRVKVTGERPYSTAETIGPVGEPGLNASPGLGEPGSIFAAMSSCCSIHCECVVNNGCGCDHDCTCPDKSLADPEAELTFSFDDIQKLQGAMTDFPSHVSVIPDALPISDEEAHDMHK